MALQNTISNLKDMLSRLSHDLTKAETGNKAAAQRVRTTTVRLEKLAKAYRKESIASEKSNRGPMRKSASKKGIAARPAKARTPAKPAASRTSAANRSKPKAKSTLARPRALAFKKPSAKLPIRKG